MKQTTIKIDKRTHRRLQRHAKPLLPKTSARRLAETIIVSELDAREGKK